MRPMSPMIPWATRLKRAVVALSDAYFAQGQADRMAGHINDIAAVADEMFALDLLSDSRLGNIATIQQASYGYDRQPGWKIVYYRYNSHESITVMGTDLLEALVKLGQGLR